MHLIPIDFVAMATFMTDHAAALLAQATLPGTTLPASVPATGLKPPGAWLVFLQQYGALIFFGIVIYFLFMRSKRKQDQARKDQMSSLKKGARVQTIGGIIGTVVSSDENEVLLKVDESNNTKMKFTRRAISTVFPDESGKTDTK